jgi:hypothetical protein
VLNGSDTGALTRHARTEDRGLAHDFQHKNQHKGKAGSDGGGLRAMAVVEAGDDTYDPPRGGTDGSNGNLRDSSLRRRASRARFTKLSPQRRRNLGASTAFAPPHGYSAS